MYRSLRGIYDCKGALVSKAETIFVLSQLVKFHLKELLQKGAKYCFTYGEL